MKICDIQSNSHRFSETAEEDPQQLLETTLTTVGMCSVDTDCRNLGRFCLLRDSNMLCFSHLLSTCLIHFVFLVAAANIDAWLVSAAIIVFAPEVSWSMVLCLCRCLSFLNASEGFAGIDETALV